MDNSPDRNMPPPAEGRRSITMNSMVGERSGTSTPKSLTTPITPIPQSSASSGRSKMIAKSFTQYTQAVVNSATRTVHRDTVKTRLEKQTLEKDRWQKHYQGFVTMAEEQSRQLKKSQLSSERSEEALRKLEEVQEKAIEGMASCMIAVGHGKPTPVLEEDNRAKHLEKEVAMLRDELNGTKRTIDNTVQDVSRTNQDMSRINDKVSFQRSRLEEQIQGISRDHVTKQTLTATESKIAESTVNISKLQMKQDEINDQILKLSEQLKALPSKKLDKLQDTTIKMEDQVNSLKSLTFDVSQAKEDIFKMSGNASITESDTRNLKRNLESHIKDFQEFRNNVTEQMEKLKELNEFVTGDENTEEKSLTGIVKEGDRKITKHADALQNLNNELGELDNLKEEFRSLGARMTNMEARPLIQPSTSSDQSKVSNGLDTEVAMLKEEVARITREQQEKDDIVAEEVDRMGNLLNQKNEEVERLSKLLDNQEASIKNMNDQISSLRSYPVAAKEVERLSKLLNNQEVTIENMNDRISHSAAAKEVERVSQLLNNQAVFITNMNDQISYLQTHSAVAEEVERLRKLLNNQEVSIKNMNNQISNLQAHSVAVIPRKSSTPSPQVNGVRPPEEPVLRQKIEALETNLKQFKESSWEKLSTTEVFVASQEKRFNNLTTEHMARSIINQMQRLYPPHPGNVMGEIHQVKSRQQAVEELFRAFQGRLEILSNFLAPAHLIQVQKHTILNLQADVKKVFESLAQTEQDSKTAIKDVKDAIHHHSIKIESFGTDINTIKDQHLSAVETSKTELAAIRTDIKDIEATTIQECSHVTGEIAALSKTIERTTKNPAHSDTDASSTRKHPPKSHLAAAADDSDTLSPSRHRAGSIRSAASTAKAKLASVTSNGNGTPTRKSRRKRERGSEGSESDWHPGRKVGRIGGE